MAYLPEITIITLFFLAALFYSAIGFGGGSTYLAIMSFFFQDFELIRTTALLCNIVVVSGSVVIFYRNGLISWKRFLPLIAFSIPAAFFGAQVRFSQTIFFIILGIALIASACMLLFQLKERMESTKNAHAAYLSYGIGGGIGLISGMVGIGGGVFLSPLLHILQWDTARKIAALSSVFILINSLAGLGGLAIGNNLNWDASLLPFLIASVILGGQIGSRLTIRFLSPRIIKILTACLVFYVGLRLILQHLVGVMI